VKIVTISTNTEAREKKNSALNMPTFKVEEMPPEQESFEQIPGANYFRLC